MPERKIEKIGGMWFVDDVLVADPICAAFKEQMKDPEFAERIFEEAMAHNPLLRKFSGRD